MLAPLEHSFLRHDCHANVLWTEKEREQAVRGHVTTDINDLRTQLQSQYQDSVKAACETYLRIPANIIFSQVNKMRMTYLRRYTLLGTTVTAQGEGRWKLYQLFIPYLLKGIKDHGTIYQTIKVVFADLFHWIHDVIELQLPEKYELLPEVVSILPGNNLSPIFPFLSLVINLNVFTKGHQDSKDKDFCLVLPIDNFQGGALVMVETGLVLEIRQVDFAILRSCDIMHFNLQYQEIDGQIM
ncbi:hypothetical protein SERLA73DRAFT_149226 [Serpula lacrymans var. lacrymans S7.3]|uniref:Uncharacterized protein n=1 Tax=Serpula lacrymans var. lacrymans (strain S7.3) TaxID=936435 RepID=F8PGT6_SERL3|nr:hypothetical protein SERLA73DRAFT_149226 [Serpula lacrymans var. lacrymans S7.3]